MSGSARSFAREGELHAQLHESKNTGEECDSAWLMWEATMLATALDTNRNTNIRSEFRDFPDFGPWAFSSWTEDGRQQDSDVRLFMGICFRLLSLLGCQMPALDYGDIEDASEAIRELQHDPFPSAPGRQHSLVIYALLHKVSPTPAWEITA
ncbi:hypothetical protein, conserved [Eimeria acervulina]|uniref:Uncharacterized protein n=1 Tax=Eimeria acervulina TaxID=5801 RepID=U6GS46_EIMAC|nr:hypothetical protein, conserved [Eimeria acervulina]CDI82407.1 hypothetical protein, conserved [Eimeria acervulina]